MTAKPGNGIGITFRSESLNRCVVGFVLPIQGDEANLSWTPAMAMPPSPTAAAQRFTDPERTSPAAKMAGRLVSSGLGGRLFSFPAGAFATSVPGWIDPF